MLYVAMCKAIYISNCACYFFRQSSSLIPISRLPKLENKFSITSFVMITFVFITVLLILFINIAIVLLFTYSLPIVLLLPTLLFCVSSSFFILVIFPFNFFTGYGAMHKVNNILIQIGGHLGLST